MNFDEVAAKLTCSHLCVENRGASVRIGLAAKASPGKSSRVTAHPYIPKPPAALSLGSAGCRAMAWRWCDPAQRCYLPACRIHLSCIRAALGGGLFNLRPTTQNRVWGVLFCSRVVFSTSNQTSLRFLASVKRCPEKRYF
jgi:hypothetical protein